MWHYSAQGLKPDFYRVDGAPKFEPCYLQRLKPEHETLSERTQKYQIPTTKYPPTTNMNRPRPAARSQQLSALHNRVIPIARQLRPHCLRFLRIAEGADLDVEQRIAGRGGDKYRILFFAQSVDQDVRVFLL